MQFATHGQKWSILSAHLGSYLGISQQFLCSLLICDFVVMSPRLTDNLARHTVAWFIDALVNFIAQGFLQLGRLHLFVLLVEFFDRGEIHLESLRVAA